MHWFDQQEPGKSKAVRKGFEMASGEITICENLQSDSAGEDSDFGIRPGIPGLEFAA